MAWNIARWALGVSIASAAISCAAIYVSSQSAQRALSDSRQSLLMDRRIDACLEFYDAGMLVEEQARAAFYLPQGPVRLSQREVQDLFSNLHEAVMSTYGLQRRLTLLGPDSLVAQASAVTEAASETTDSIVSPADAEKTFDVAHTELESALVSFIVSCTVVARDYRANDPDAARRMAEISASVRTNRAAELEHQSREAP